ncbi:MAG: hypothetical protein IT538_06545 [Variibacter sp.]|nr:hypothetical protein [Variibacter sp.]
MRRQTGSGGHSPAGTGRCARLDPLALPVRFTATDAAADGRVRSVEIDRDRVLLRRRVRGMPIHVAVPIDAFQGVSVRLTPAEDGEDESVTVRLEHRDPALAIEVYEGPDDADVIAEWQLWARVLDLPLLMADPAGRLHDPFARMGSVTTCAPKPRRRRRNARRRRRPTLPLRRKPGDGSLVMPVHREAEIIARN